MLVVFAAIYHWYPKITGRMFHEGMAKLHFWCTFLGTYAIYLPMHYLGFLGVPRRYYALGTTDFIPASAQDLNTTITTAALFVGASQLLFFINVFWSLRNGPKADPNPWGAASLEWQTPDTPPVHGIGAILCQQYTAGLMTTACRAQNKTLFLRTLQRKKDPP